MAKYKVKQCEKCGKRYKPNSSRQKFCGSRANKRSCSYKVNRGFIKNFYKDNSELRLKHKIQWMKNFIKKHEGNLIKDSKK